MTALQFLFPYSPSFGTVSPPSPADRRTLVDPYNQIQNARYIDPVTQDYVLKANGHPEGMPGIRQSVYLALLTQFNSSAQLNFGAQLSSIKVVTASIVAEVSNFVRVALSQLISNKQILLNNVSVTNNGRGQVVVNIRWTDLSTGQANTTQLGSQAPISNLRTSP